METDHANGVFPFGVLFPPIYNSGTSKFSGVTHFLVFQYNLFEVNKPPNFFGGIMV